MRTVALTSLALLVGCLSVDPPEGRLACTEARVEKDCPSGWACVEGFCHRSPRDVAAPEGGVDAEAALDGAVAVDGKVPVDGNVAMDADEVECTSASECDDGSDCSVDTCEDNVCQHVFTTNEQADLPDESGSDQNCDGADGVVTRDLYVAPGATGTGSFDDPMSFEAALAAFEGDRHILVAVGDYAIEAPLVAPNAVRIHGGYALNYRSRPGGTRVLSLARQALIIRDVTAATIDRVDWETADATSPGAHTQTVSVLSSNGVLLRGLAIVAGDGAPGASGAMGAAGSPPGAAGPNGDNGNGTVGGAGASCGSPGGQGGGINGPQVAGTSAAVVGTGCGNGGAQGITTNDNRSCEAGQTYVGFRPGGPGDSGCPQLGRGAVGAGGSGAGSIAGESIWSGAGGGRGGNGPQGNAGGGGGGGGSYYRNECASSAGGGGGGGCGGIGGDGGDGGEPGQAGGASIAMVVQDSVVTLEGVILRTGAGAVGGRGGDGGPGAEGVAGSGGGGGGTVTGTSSTSHRGSSGGAGGTGSAGGTGGCGGGGAGGSTIGVFLVGSGSIDPQSVTYELGEAGSGGAACPAAATDTALGNAGEAGMAVEVFSPP
jgi:hypothetical protein